MYYPNSQQKRSVCSSFIASTCKSDTNNNSIFKESLNKSIQQIEKLSNRYQLDGKQMDKSLRNLEYQLQNQQNLSTCTTNSCKCDEIKTKMLNQHQFELDKYSRFKDQQTKELIEKVKEEYRNEIYKKIEKIKYLQIQNDKSKDSIQEIRRQLEQALSKKQKYKDQVFKQKQMIEEINNDHKIQIQKMSQNVNCYSCKQSCRNSYADTHILLSQIETSKVKIDNSKERLELKEQQYNKLKLKYQNLKEEYQYIQQKSKFEDMTKSQTTQNSSINEYIYLQDKQKLHQQIYSLQDKISNYKQQVNDANQKIDKLQIEIQTYKNKETQLNQEIKNLKQQIELNILLQQEETQEKSFSLELQKQLEIQQQDQKQIHEQKVKEIISLIEYQETNKEKYSKLQEYFGYEFVYCLINLINKLNCEQTFELSQSMQQKMDQSNQCDLSVQYPKQENCDDTFLLQTQTKTCQSQYVQQNKHIDQDIYCFLLAQANAIEQYNQ